MPVTFGKYDCRICGKVYKSKEGLANRHQKKYFGKCGTANEDYLTRQIFTNSKLPELVIKDAEKIKKQGHYPANLKDEILVYNCIRKKHG